MFAVTWIKCNRSYRIIVAQYHPVAVNRMEIFLANVSDLITNMNLALRSGVGTTFIVVVRPFDLQLGEC